MVLVLDLYDLIKQVRKMAKVGHKMSIKDQKWEHPCDLPIKHYQVVDHSKGVTKAMQFNMNAALMQSNVTCQNQRLMSTENSGATAQAETNNAILQAQNACNDPKRKANNVEIYHLEREPAETAPASEQKAAPVYSVSSHFERASKKKQSKGKKIVEKPVVVEDYTEAKEEVVNEQNVL